MTEHISLGLDTLVEDWHCQERKAHEHQEGIENILHLLFGPRWGL